MNIETAAQAINRVDEERSRWPSWEELGGIAKALYRAEATAAIDAYRTLTADQWEAQRENVARAICGEEGVDPDSERVILTGTRHPYWTARIAHADAAMSALGFRRAEEKP